MSSKQNMKCHVIEFDENMTMKKTQTFTNVEDVINLIRNQSKEQKTVSDNDINEDLDDIPYIRKVNEIKDKKQRMLYLCQIQVKKSIELCGYDASMEEIRHNILKRNSYMRNDKIFEFLFPQAYNLVIYRALQKGRIPINDK